MTAANPPDSVPPDRAPAGPARFGHATPAALAALHGRCFRRPRPWTAEELAALLGGRGVFLLTRPGGFLVGRAVAGEAEMLTLAVDPDRRRTGTGRALCHEFAVRSRQLGGETAFLEVAADNIPAQMLYAAAGWRRAGLRRRYYGADLDALVLTLDLTEPATAAESPGPPIPAGRGGSGSGDQQDG